MPKTPVVMPKMSMTMTEGEVVEITVAVGQTVIAGDVVAVVGTDKTDMEVESDHSGTVIEVVAGPGNQLQHLSRLQHQPQHQSLSLLSNRLLR